MCIRDSTLASVEAYDLAGAGAHWTLLAASMTTPRTGHAAAVLRGLIYAAGGDSIGNTVERFDGGAHSTWALVASMGTARHDFALVALEEGGPSHHGGMLVASSVQCAPAARSKASTLLPLVPPPRAKTVPLWVAAARNVRGVVMYGSCVQLLAAPGA